MVRRVTPLLLLLSLVVSTAALAQPPDLDAWVARAMKTFEVPGIGLAIVKDERVVVAKGYGVRKLGDPAPVDARTLFGIASNTKAVHRDRARACWSRSTRSNGTRRSCATCRPSRCGIRTSPAS